MSGLKPLCKECHREPAGESLYEGDGLDVSGRCDDCWMKERHKEKGRCWKEAFAGTGTHTCICDIGQCGKEATHDYMTWPLCTEHYNEPSVIAWYEAILADTEDSE